MSLIKATDDCKRNIFSIKDELWTLFNWFKLIKKLIITNNTTIAIKLCNTNDKIANNTRNDKHNLGL